METKFTKGEWFIQQEMENEVLCRRFPAGIDSIATIHNQFDDETSKANAKLIAAAPELLKACNVAMIDIMTGTANQHTIDVLLETIKQATE